MMEFDPAEIILCMIEVKHLEESLETRGFDLSSIGEREIRELKRIFMTDREVASKLFVISEMVVERLLRSQAPGSGKTNEKSARVSPEAPKDNWPA